MVSRASHAGCIVAVRLSLHVADRTQGVLFHPEHGTV
jgi:hypothetical protein